jgi:DnaK suppressor protein
MTMTAKAGTDTRYHRALMAKRRALAAELAVPGDAPLHLSEDDRPAVLQHEAVSAELNNLGYTQLRLIQEALDRIAAGDFGTCLRCEQPIPPRRLQAVPWARYCVRCQEIDDESARMVLLDDDGGPVG